MWCFFHGEFYGEKEASRTKEKMIKAYRLRQKLLLFYRKNDKDFQIDKTKKAISIIKELKV